LDPATDVPNRPSSSVRVQAGYPVSFGTDLAGEMYVCSFDLNTVFRIVAA
jgi:hypothetical protein